MSWVQYRPLIGLLLQEFSNLWITLGLATRTNFIFDMELMECNISQPASRQPASRSKQNWAPFCHHKRVLQISAEKQQDHRVHS
ncbi:hypothetical protein DOY81_008568 [Sarcophaga bullata]|nr:hypothetical protein DOY81_008568 [Sarcophaga bullata]